MTGQPASRPAPEAPPNRIGTLEFRFDLVDGPGPLGTPERLLLAVRADLLETVGHVLAATSVGRADLRLETVEIDLGAFPDPPDWPAVRRRLAETLTAALAPHLGSPLPDRAGPGTGAPIPARTLPRPEAPRGPAPAAATPAAQMPTGPAPSSDPPPVHALPTGPAPGRTGTRSR
ncbi:hypothetical protein JMJ94_13635, partial [Rhodovulum visakhapatnamense]|nr:hypothetical protein [Rhodovulum visakhapatnamense]